MGFFKNIFKSKQAPTPPGNPDNTRLIYLLNVYSEHRSDVNYKLVVEELLKGNSFLMLPTLNEQGSPANNWSATKEDTTLQLTSVVDIDGLKALAVFTDEKSLVNWTKQVTTYIALKSQAVLDMCKDLKVNRVVINSGSPNIFMVERADKAQKVNIKAGETFYLGTPARPLDKSIVEKLVAEFYKNSNISKAYQAQMV